MSLQKSKRQDQTREIDMSFRQLIRSYWERDQQGDSFDRGVGLFFADESITLCTDSLVGSEDGLDFVPGSSLATTRRSILRRIRSVPPRGKYWRRGKASLLLSKFGWIVVD